MMVTMKAEQGQLDSTQRRQRADVQAPVKEFLSMIGLSIGRKIIPALSKMSYTFPADPTLAADCAGDTSTIFGPCTFSGSTLHLSICPCIQLSTDYVSIIYI